MAEEEPAGFVELRHPVQCVLWEEPERLEGRGFAECLAEVASYEDSSHMSRSLHKCPECGQLYFHEWWEWVDWEGGNDKQYTTLIPVQTQEEIDALRQGSVYDLLRYSPRLQWNGAKISWIGKA